MDKKLLLTPAEKMGGVDAFVYATLNGEVRCMLVMNKNLRNTNPTTITEHVAAIIHSCKISPV